MLAAHTLLLVSTNGPEKNTTEAQDWTEVRHYTYSTQWKTICYKYSCVSSPAVALLKWRWISWSQATSVVWKEQNGSSQTTSSEKSNNSTDEKPSEIMKLNLLRQRLVKSEMFLHVVHWSLSSGLSERTTEELHDVRWWVILKFLIKYFQLQRVF